MAGKLKIRRPGAEPLVLSLNDAFRVSDWVDEVRFADEVEMRLENAPEGTPYSQARFLLEEGFGTVDDIVACAMETWYDQDWEMTREEALEAAFEDFCASTAAERSAGLRRERRELAWH